MLINQTEAARLAYLSTAQGLHRDGISAEVANLTELEALVDIRSPNLTAVIHGELKNRRKDQKAVS
jgi:hypothetical protein